MYSHKHEESLYGSALKFSKSDLVNASFLDVKVIDKNDRSGLLSHRFGKPTNIATRYEMSIYGALLSKYGMLAAVSMERWESRMPEY